MGTDKFNMSNTPYKYMVAGDQENLDKPLPPHWTTAMEAYNSFGYNPTPLLNQRAAGSYMSLCMLPNEASSTLLQPALHDPMRFSSKPTVARDAALAFSEMVHRNFGERNLNAMERCTGNLQPKILTTMEQRETGNKSSILKNDKEGDGVMWSAESVNKGSPDEDHDTRNDFPSTTKQQCDLMLANANSNEQNRNLEMSLNQLDTYAHLVKLEKDKIRKERKRQSNRESAKRSRMRREKECEELHKNMGTLKDENSLLTQRLMRLSEECLELRDENDSIQDELVKIYGPESIADLLPMKPS